MLVIRLIRIGKKHSQDFRLVVTDKRNPPRGGRFLEVLGHYNPKLKEKKFNEEKIKHWLEKGAKPSDTCFNLLVGAGIVGGPKKKIKISPANSKKEEKGAPPEEKKEKVEGA